MPLKDDGDEASTGQEAKDGMIGGTGVAIAGLKVVPIQEVDEE